MSRTTRPLPVDTTGKVHIHAPCCHRDTMMRRRGGEMYGAVCWNCGALLPLVKSCAFHDPRIVNHPDDTIDERLARFDGDYGCHGWDDDERFPCPEVWSVDEVEAIPDPISQNGCDGCPEPFVVTRWDGLLFVGWGGTSWIRWDPDEVYRWTRPEDAWKFAVRNGGRADRLDRVTGQ